MRPILLFNIFLFNFFMNPLLQFIFLSDMVINLGVNYFTRIPVFLYYLFFIEIKKKMALFSIQENLQVLGEFRQDGR
jgi:hypothetical protein